MPTTYTLEILELKKRVSDGAVEQVVWKKTGTDEDGISASYEDISYYNNVDPSSPNFIDFNKLTEAEVLQWIMQDSVYESCDMTIRNLIAEKRIQVQAVSPSEFPWAAPSE